MELSLAQAVGSIGSVALFLGGSLMSIFAQSVVPERWHKAAFWLGVCLAGAGAFVGVLQILTMTGHSKVGVLWATATLVLLVGAVATGWQAYRQLRVQDGLTEATPSPQYSRPKIRTPEIAANAGTASFDYSTKDGIIDVGEGDCLFRLAFSKASDTAIHMMTAKRTGGLESEGYGAC